MEDKVKNNIYESLCNILNDVEGITKSKTNQQQGYKFRGIDDMYNALHPLFKKHNVFITTNLLSSKREERTTAKGGLLIYTIVSTEIIFNAIDGSFVRSVLEGEAMDSGDKSTNKAMSAALKYALMQMFLIPTEENLDTEKESPEPTPKQQTPPPAPKKDVLTMQHPNWGKCVTFVSTGGNISELNKKYTISTEIMLELSKYLHNEQD
jgi:hypothetical protein